MPYYVFHKDLKKNRRAVDLSKIDAFCKEIIRKDKEAERIRKGDGKNGKKKRFIRRIIETK